MTIEDNEQEAEELKTGDAVRYADAAIGELQKQIRDADQQAAKDRAYIQELLAMQAKNAQDRTAMQIRDNDQREQIVAMEVIAERYVMVLDSLTAIFRDLGDPLEEDWLGKLSTKMGDRDAKQVLDSYIEALLEQFGSEEGVERAMYRRYIADLEGLLEYAHRANKDGMCSVYVSEKTIVLSIAGIRLEMGRIDSHRGVLAQRVAEDFATLAAPQDPLPVAE